MANEQRDVGEVGDPCIYFLRIDLGLAGRSPEDCDILAQKIGRDVFMNFRVKDVTFCSDVELKKMFRDVYQKIFDDEMYRRAEAIRKQTDETIAAAARAGETK